jgi:hypothetical protein
VLHCSWLIQSQPNACPIFEYGRVPGKNGDKEVMKMIKEDLISNKSFRRLYFGSSAKFNPFALKSFTIILSFPLYAHNLRPRHDTPSADLVVSVTSEKSLAISGPGERNTLGLAALLALLNVLGLELVDLALLLEVEDGDAAAGSSAEPVAVGGEDKGVNLITGVERVEVLGLVEIPEHSDTVLTTGGTEGSIGGNGDGVDVASVTDVVGLEAAGSEFPNLFVLLVAALMTYNQDYSSKRNKQTGLACPSGIW